MAIFAPIVTGAADDPFIVAIANAATAAIAIANFEALIIIKPLVVSVLQFCYATIRLRTVTAGVTEIGLSVTPGKLCQGSTRYSRRPPAYEPGLGRYTVSCGVVDADQRTLLGAAPVKAGAILLRQWRHSAAAATLSAPA
jgi:hypothetical protein